MVAKTIDGKKLAKKLRQEIAVEIKTLKENNLKLPALAVILVGNDKASHIYVKNKRKACEEVGIKSIYNHLPSNTTQNKINELINNFNLDPEISGILLQLPLPHHINSQELLESIDPKKDVDGFHPYNLGRLAQRRPLLRPCTPYGIMMMLDSIKENYKGKHAVIVGASNIVGRPMALELLSAGCTTTSCHKFTKNLSQYVKQADILVSATGIPKLIKGEWIKEGATVIDVGINRLDNGTIIGDIEFSAAKEKAGYITPVPGGVGPMTTATLLKNTLSAHKNYTNI